MLALHPYITFEGNCEEAFDFYRSVFGGQFQFVGRYKDVPSDTQISPEEANKIMHIALPLTHNVILMGSDMSQLVGEKVHTGNRINLSISTENEEETKRIFTQLSQGGSISMPLERTFWADLYGVFCDKYGVNWIVNFVAQDDCCAQQ